MADRPFPSFNYLLPIAASAVTIPTTARMEFLDPNLGFWWRRWSGTLSGKLSNPPEFLGQKATYRRGGRPRSCLGWPNPLQARGQVGPHLGWVWAPQASSLCPLLAPWIL